MKNILVFFLICTFQLNAQEYGGEEKKIIPDKELGVHHQRLLPTWKSTMLGH